MDCLKRVLFGFLFPALTFTYSFAQPLKQTSSKEATKLFSDRLNRIDQVLKSSIDSGWINGAIGYIAKDGKVIYDKAFGTSDANAEMKPDAIFRIASQTKAITSVAIMMLFEEGKLLLDDPVSKYIPAFSKPVVLDQFSATDSTYTTVPAKREITLRDLLTHTSGIDYAAIGTAKMRAIYAKAGVPSGLGDARGALTLKEAIPILGKLPLAHQPGERFTYGLNSDVLGYVVEVVSGQKLDRFFQEKIFTPLGMNDTYFYLPASKQSRLVAVYTMGPQRRLVKMVNNNPDYPKANGTYFSGGAGLSSTITDYAVFLQMLLNGGVYNGHRLLSRRTVELMTSNQIGELNVGVDKFGLGFEITTEKGFLKLGMSRGSFSWGGFFGTTYWVDPSEKLVCLLFIQQSPLRSEVQDKFKALVYQALD